MSIPSVPTKLRNYSGSWPTLLYNYLVALVASIPGGTTKPQVYATNAGAQGPISSGSVVAIIDWTAVMNTGGDLTASTGVFVVPTANFFADVRAQLAWGPASAPGGTGYGVHIQRSIDNGVTWTDVVFQTVVAQTTVSSQAFFPTVAVCFMCNLGDQIRVAGSQTSGSPTSTSGWMSIAQAN